VKASFCEEKSPHVDLTGDLKTEENTGIIETANEPSVRELQELIKLWKM
jgi:hypothetical protein